MCSVLQEEARELLQSHRREFDCNNDSSAESSLDSRLSSQPFALFERLRRGRKGVKEAGKEEGRPKALIIDGGTLQFVLDASLKPLFVDIAKRCVSVICSRATPIQKV